MAIPHKKNIFKCVFLVAVELKSTQLAAGTKLIVSVGVVHKNEHFGQD